MSITVAFLAGRSGLLTERRQPMHRSLCPGTERIGLIGRGLERVRDEGINDEQVKRRRSSGIASRKQLAQQALRCLDRPFRQNVDGVMSGDTDTLAQSLE
jgi:hypothetical protein